MKDKPKKQIQIGVGLEWAWTVFRVMKPSFLWDAPSSWWITRDKTPDRTRSEGSAGHIWRSRLGNTVTSSVGATRHVQHGRDEFALIRSEKANCLPFTTYIIYSPLALKGHSEFLRVIFPDNTLDTMKELNAFVFVSVPRNVSLAMWAFIIGGSQTPARFPTTWRLTQTPNVTLFFRQVAHSTCES